MFVDDTLGRLALEYIFSDMNRKKAEYLKNHPEKSVKDIITLGMGDVSLPLTPSVYHAGEYAWWEMSQGDTFRGYAPEEGYKFLCEAICGYYSGAEVPEAITETVEERIAKEAPKAPYSLRERLKLPYISTRGKRGIALSPEEVFINDGSQSAIGALSTVFGFGKNIIAPEPAYPVYAETNWIRGNKISYVYGTEQNNFLPMPDYDQKPDIIYLCSPANPTGSVYSRKQLKEWVDYANSNDAVIIFDCAYETYIRDSRLPRSIYEVKGARECAIEVGSFSKSAGFTGVRCGYVIIPKELNRKQINGEVHNLNYHYRRQRCAENKGVSYSTQRAAEAALATPEGLAEINKNLDYYLENAKIIKKALKKLGITCIGGTNAPYIWAKCPEGMKSWDFFDLLLEKANVIGTPGVGFGKTGEGYFRFSALGTRENVVEAMKRITEALGQTKSLKVPLRQNI